MEQKTCQACGHKVAARMIRCLYCGAPLALDESKPARTCPRCEGALQETLSKWVAIDRCSSCSGEFYDRCELDRSAALDESATRWLSDNMFPRPADTTSGKPLICPGCRGEMRTFAVAASEDLKIDVCGKCKGTWLDAGESERLRRAALQGLSGKLQPVGLADAETAVARSFGLATGYHGHYGHSLKMEAAELLIDGIVGLLD